MTNVNLKCKFCNCIFSTPLKRFNYLFRNKCNNFYCSRKCFLQDKSSTIITKVCLYCKKSFESSTRSDSKKCCSLDCSHKYAQSFADPQKAAVATSEVWKRRHLTQSFVYKQRTCKNCGGKFERRNTDCCSEICAREGMSNGGRKSAESQQTTRSSKNEVMFANLCKSLFFNVLTNKRMFNGWDADVILPGEKVAVLWNGNWHRKKLTVKHSVEQVKNRDKIKLDEIVKMGYTPYTIEDYGKENSLFVASEFDKFKLFIDERRVV